MFGFFMSKFREKGGFLPPFGKEMLYDKCREHCIKAADRWYRPADRRGDRIQEGEEKR